MRENVESSGQYAWAEPEYSEYVEVDALQDESTAAGWNIDYRQLEAGQAIATVRTGLCDDVTLLQETCTRRLDVAGDAPREAISVLLPQNGSRIWANGATANDAELVFVHHEQDLHLISSSDVDVLSAHVPFSRLPGIADEGVGHIPIDRIPLSARPRPELHHRMHVLMQLATSTVPPRGMRAQLAATLGDCVVQIAEDLAPSRVTPRLTSLRTIRIACEIIEASLGESLSIAVIANHAGVSLSTLERIFRRELQVSPSRYIRSRRLAAIRRALKKKSCDETSVTDTAMQYGFYHLGRFSSLYRSQFGELPSATLAGQY